MTHTSPAHHKRFEDFRAHWRAVAPDCDAVDLDARPPSALLAPLERELGGGRTLRLANRFVVHPMEGWDGDEQGRPSADTLRRWRRFGRSGAGLIWGGEAFAVQADGRANPHQLYLNDALDVRAELERLRAEVRAGRRVVVLEDGGGSDELLAGVCPDGDTGVGFNIPPIGSKE